MIFESLKYNSKMVCIIMFTAVIDKDVIDKDYDKHVQVLLEHTVHQVHENCRGIAGSDVYLREIVGTLKLVKSVIDSRKWILILDRDFIELTAVPVYPSGYDGFTHWVETEKSSTRILGLVPKSPAI
ncbi:hypothetical protein CQW23_24467 [Capsicum baccatum]|uniref:Uncharacterized protein n=1 Tax=Capsicum baccatum TaxID=33114 RepID=A0A2G2VUW1_CAPBA|nr:hypothetical protein CQW23_24467 [Capsicum baccatum]